MIDNSTVQSSPFEPPEKAESTSSNPMTDAQRTRLDTLSGQTSEPTPDDHLSRVEAAQKIEELRDEAGYDTSTDDLDEP